MQKSLFIKSSLTFLVAALLAIGIQKVDWHRTPTPNCPYCDPLNFKNQLIYCGNSAAVIITHKPAVPGHLLIIPNRHVQQFDQLKSAEIAEMGELIKRVHQIYMKRFQTAEYILIQKNGPLAGQSVPHVHIHILPRTKEMGTLPFLSLFMIRPLLKPLNETEMKKYIESIGTL